MANVKKEIEDRLRISPRMEQLWDVSALIDRQIKVKTKKLKIDDYYDADECIITYVADVSIYPYIQPRAIRDSMKLLEDPSSGLHIIKTIYTGYTQGIDPSTGYNYIDVEFVLVNNFEK